jgi:DNA-binding CsgD family transcriptional regulator
VQLVAGGMFVSQMDAIRPLLARLSLFAGSADDDAPAAGQLSPRELEVLRLVADGMDNRTIAERMVLSEGTVKAHVSHILAKLSVRTRAELVRYALTREVFAFEFEPPDGTTPEISGHMHQHITLRFTAKGVESNEPFDLANELGN